MCHSGIIAVCQDSRTWENGWDEVPRPVYRCIRWFTSIVGPTSRYQETAQLPYLDRALRGVLAPLGIRALMT
jgi:hypothetical protein